jgi:hypothetical protein
MILVIIIIIIIMIIILIIMITLLILIMVAIIMNATEKRVFKERECWYIPPQSSVARRLPCACYFSIATWLCLPWLLARDAHFRLCTRTRSHLSLLVSRGFHLLPRVVGTVPSQYSQLSKLNEL